MTGTAVGADSEGLETAYYYPEPYWLLDETDRLKTLLLFFDEIATLLPRYMRGREVAADPVLAGPLQERGLLRVLEPEVFIDQQMTEDLSAVLADLITGGAFDGLDTEVGYAALSRSRMGWDADVGLASMVIKDLEDLGLARPSPDGKSVPLHPVVRTTVLVLLAQLARAGGPRHGLNLHPTAGRAVPVDALVQTLARDPLPSAGHVVALDLQAVTFDLASVPLDEVLDFRAQHGSSYRAYARDLRHLLIQLGPLEAPDRERLLRDRQEELADRAADLRRTVRQAWRQELPLYLGLVGAVWEGVGKKDILTALLSLAGGVVGTMLGAVQQPAGAYSYLLSAQHTLGARGAAPGSG